MNFEQNTSPLKTTRLHSLDTLRGMDMFFIMGGDALFLCLGALLPNTIMADWGRQMGHMAWDGFAFYDLIFPLFLFIAGISFPFSLSKSMAKETSKGRISMKILRRGITLIILGWLYNGLLSIDFENMRYASVLGRIGSAWMIASLLYLWFSKKVCYAIGGAILLGYWALLTFVSAPDFPDASPMSMEGSIVGYVDRLLMPGKLHLGIHDPEGLLSTLPAVCTALMGIMVGDFIRNSKRGGHYKSATLLLLGTILLALGWTWDIVMPVNKNLWTSSFVCVAGGMSMILFACIYWVVDVMKWQRWTLFFRMIGMNSITIYLAQHFLDFKKPVETIFGGVLSLVPEPFYALSYWVAYILICWALLYFLYKNRIFLKV